MGSEIKNMVMAADTDAQYDEKAKQLLANKFILAYILIKTVDEFKSMSPKDVVPYIEGEPKVGAIPIELGMTNATKNKNGQKIVGLNSENSADKKLNIIEAEYDIPTTDNMRKDVNVMCNLSQGIRDDANLKTSKKFIMSMYKKGYTLEQIADVAEKSIEEIKAVIEEKEPALM